MNQATLDIPADGQLLATRHTGLFDADAIRYGLSFARTLTESDGYVVVTLSDGTVKAFGYDTILGVVTVGTITRSSRYV